MLLGIDWYGMFIIFIPVYAFLMLPAVATLTGETNDFLARSAKVQWGLMLTVYSISHAPALLMLDTGVPSALLIVYLIIVVQLSDVFQYVWGKLIGKHRFSPNISPSKTLEGLVGGGLSAILVGTLLYRLTPFSPLQAAAVSAVIVDRRLLRRLRAVGDQTRPQGEGLGLHHRGPWRGARPRRFADLRRAAVLPRDALLVHHLSKPVRPGADMASANFDWNDDRRINWLKQAVPRLLHRGCWQRNGDWGRVTGRQPAWFVGLTDWT